MPARHQIVVETTATSFGMGRADSTSLRGAYRNSPIYTMTDEQVRRSFDSPAELNTSTGELNDGPNGDFGLTNRYYADSPDLSSVEVGGGGRPGYFAGPNIATSTDETNPFNASAIPTDGVEATERARTQRGGGFGNGDGLTSPSTTTPRIARRSLSTVLTPGSSFVR